MKLYVLAIVFILLLQREAFSCPQRRRRSPPSPPPRNCQVSGWSYWGECSHRCGSSGTKTRTRTKWVSECCGGRCNYQIRQVLSCNRHACTHGGTPMYGRCSCPPGWTGTCCERDVNECLNMPRPCQHYCHNSIGSYTCSCSDCYRKYGTRCHLMKCKISGKCYTYGTVNPRNQCQDCRKSNKWQWSNNNALGCSDGNSCTRNDHCNNGVCRGTPFTCRSCERCDGNTCQIKPGFCVIDGTCYKSNQIRSGKPCQQCNSNKPTKWTANNNLKCSDNNIKTRNDRCINGNCRGQPFTCLPCQDHYNDACQVKTGYCVIRYNNVDTCYSKNHVKPGNACQKCNPKASKAVWTNKNGDACDDGNKCTRSDTCHNGQCKGTSFTCNNLCQYCNGNDCTLKTGYGYVGGKCTCKIQGRDYYHQHFNPANECQWCDLYDRTTKSSAEWSNRPASTCNDGNACTKQDLCKSGRCVGTSFVCQSSYLQSSCIQTSLCNGDGTCRDSMKANGTICRPAFDQCDQPERCNGILGTCPPKSINSIKLKEGQATITSKNFLSSVFFQSSVDTLHLNLNGFSANCGALNIKWSLLHSTDDCLLNVAKATLLLNKHNHLVNGLNLQNTKAYKIVVQANDMRGKTGIPVCTNPVTIDTSKPARGWIRDGLGSTDLQYQSYKIISALWGGFTTVYGIANYHVSVSYKQMSVNEYQVLQDFLNINLNVSFTKTFSSITDGSHVKTKVRAFTKAGLYSEISSNGVTVDTSPPSQGSVFDGEIEDNKYANWTKTFHATWTRFTDMHSPIVNYKIGVKRKNLGLVSSGLTSVGIAYTATISGLSLVSGVEYCALVEGFNAAGLSSQALSNCVLIDHDVPKPGIVNDGSSSDINYQSSDTVFFANWNGFDDGPRGSGIREYKYMIEDISGKAVTSWVTSGLQTNITVQGVHLVNGKRYFMLIRAIDNVGLYTEVKSDGVYIDTTHPVYSGNIVIEGQTGIKNGETITYIKLKTSLKASWPQFIDQHSGMMKYQWVITENNLQLTQWQDVPGGNFLATTTTLNSLSLNDGKEYRLTIRGFNNAGLHADIKSTIFIALSAGITLGSVSDGDDPTIDLDFQTNTSDIRATWSGFDSTNLKAYYIAVGSCIVGNYHVTNNDFVLVRPVLATSFAISGVNLVNGQRYCVKVKAENLAGIQSRPVSSDGFIVDVTPPDMKRAMVLDGNGDDDIDFQSSTTELSATWLNMVDHESGINHFEFAISRSRSGQPDVTSFINVGHNTSGKILNLSLANDVYYAIVCAINNAGLQTCLSSDGVLIDPTPASQGVVHDGIIEPDVRYQSSTTKMSANWEQIWDMDSRVERFEWGIGLSSLDQPDVQDFADVRLQTHVQSEKILDLKHGHNYSVILHVYNRAGSVRTLRSNGVIIDTTPSISSDILPEIKTEWKFHQQTATYYTSSASEIYVCWEDFREPESELWYYKWSIGTSKYGTQIQPFINIGLLTKANTTKSNIKLHPGVPYYVTVIVRNRADLVSQACSLPLVFDYSPPSDGKINVVSSKGVLKTHFTISDDIYVYWEGFHDAESGVDKYIIFTEDDYGTSVNYTKQINESSLRFPSGHLLPARIYRITLKCINNAGLSISKKSESFTIDNTPPVYRGTTDDIPQKFYKSGLRQVKVSWVSFYDKESPVVSYQIGIGTEGLRDDIQEFEDNGFATEFELSHELNVEHNKTYYVTVKAINDAGLSTSLLTDVIFIDKTPPTGQNDCVKDGLFGDDINFISIHDLISAHWDNITDLESGVDKIEYCIGTTLHNCRIKSFTNIYNNRSFVCRDCQLQHSAVFFVKLRVTNTAGLFTIFTSNGVTVDATPPEIGEAFDGERAEIPDIEKVDIFWKPKVTWYGAQDFESGIHSCEWQVVKHNKNTGIILYQKQLDNVTFNGFQTIEADTKLNFTENTSYFSVIRCSNKAGVSTHRSSNGWSVVGEWPEASYVLDGTGSHDLEFDVIGKTIGASWGKFRGDLRDPVLGYEWSLGTYPGLDDVMEFTEVGLVTSVSTSLFDTDISLQPGVRYYVTVKATSLSGKTSNKTSNGFLMDTTPPTAGKVSVSHIFDKDNNIDLTVTWDGFEDKETGMKIYEYCLGYMKDVCFTLKKIASVPNYSSMRDFVPADRYDTAYYAIVIATNKAGLKTIVSSEAFKIDTTPPMTGTVFDGVKEDWVYINSSVSLSTTWFGFHDAETGINKCTLSVTEKNLVTELKPTTISKIDVNVNGSIIHNNFSLTSGMRYTSTIECSNPGGLKAKISSNGVIVDDTPPVVPVIYHGTYQTSNIEYQTSTDILNVHWLSAQDPESGVKEYLVAVGSGLSEDDIHDFFSVGLATEVRIGNLTMLSGSSYYVTLQIVNNAGLRSRVSTSGVIIDTSPPVLSKLQLHSEIFLGGGYFIGASWSSNDDESDVVFTEYCVGTTEGQCQLRKMTPVPNNITNITCFDCQLKHKHIYFMSVRVWNNAGLFSLATTQGIQADMTPPINGDIKVENLYMPCFDRCTLSATLYGFKDDESGINNCEFTIRSSNGSVIAPVKPTTSNLIVAGGLRLENSKAYQLAVSCVNVVGLRSKEVFSAPVVIDNTSPEKGHVLVSPGSKYDMKGNHLGCQFLNSMLRIKWSGFYDKQSNIAGFRVGLGRKPLTDDIKPYQMPIIASQKQFLLEERYGLTLGDIIFATVQAINGAGLTTTVSSLPTRLISAIDTNLLNEPSFQCINI